MEIQNCRYYTKGLNYIIWKYSDKLKGIFIVHVGGDDKRELYKMFKELRETEFKNEDVYFCTQDTNFWSNHSVLVGHFDGDIEVYKLEGM